MVRFDSSFATPGRSAFGDGGMIDGADDAFQGCVTAHGVQEERGFAYHLPAVLDPRDVGEVLQLRRVLSRDEGADDQPLPGILWGEPRVRAWRGAAAAAAGARGPLADLLVRPSRIGVLRGGGFAVGMYIFGCVRSARGPRSTHGALRAANIRKRRNATPNS